MTNYTIDVLKNLYELQVIIISFIFVLMRTVSYICIYHNPQPDDITLDMMDNDPSLKGNRIPTDFERQRNYKVFKN